MKLKVTGLVLPKIFRRPVFWSLVALTLLLSVMSVFITIKYFSKLEKTSQTAKADGYSWPTNSCLYRGNRNNLAYNYPEYIQQMPELDGMIQATFFYMSEFYLKYDRTVWFRQESFGTVPFYNGLVQMPDLTGATAIGYGGSQIIAIMADGTVRTQSISLQPHNSYNFYPVPGPMSVITSLPPAANISRLGQTILLKDGTVVQGVGVINSNYNNWTAIPVVGLDNVVKVVNRMALKSDGTLWTWYSGPNSSGNYDSSFQAYQIPNISNVKDIVNGPYGLVNSGANTMALKSDGTLFVIFRNHTGSNFQSYNTPFDVVRQVNISDVKSISHPSFAVKNDGTVWDLTPIVNSNGVGNYFDPTPITTYTNLIDSDLGFSDGSQPHYYFVSGCGSDLSILKTSSGNFSPGGSVTYTIKVTNNGPYLARPPLAVSDTLPNGINLVSASGNNWICSPNGQILTCNYLANLLPGEEATITINALVPS
jgi:uncharacterized repeat protein (TIGR01451 family)